MDKTVDQWLRALAGSDYDKLGKSLSYFFVNAPDKGPITAMTIQLLPGQGMKILREGRE